LKNESIRQEFTEALDALVEQIKGDRSILAAILCGSLSYDTVWAKSDIDLVLVTIDDKKVEQSDMALYADGVNVHAFLMPRTEFRKTVEGTVRNAFMHSFLAKGRLLYTHDPTIDLCAGLGEIGDRDTQLQLLRAATQVLPPIYKARVVRHARRSRLQRAVDSLRCDAARAAGGHRRSTLADREVIPQAMN
jgi:predicted nucleotidyltransferase